MRYYVKFFYTEEDYYSDKECNIYGVYDDLESAVLATCECNMLRKVSDSNSITRAALVYNGKLINVISDPNQRHC